MIYVGTDLVSVLLLLLNIEYRFIEQLPITVMLS